MKTASIAWGLRLLLGSVFVVSAISKLLTPGLFEIAIVDQGLAATREQAAYPARLLIAFELFLGAALFFPYFLKRIILPLAIATLLAFTILQGYQLTFGEQTPDCGCFGKVLPMSSAQSLVKNVILIALSIWLFKITGNEKRNLPMPSLLAVASVVSVLVLAPVHRNYDGNFARYTQFERAGRVDLASGDRLVAVFNAECEHCQEAAKSLGALAKGHSDFPPIYVLIFGEHDTAVAAFWETTEASFPYHTISEAEFFDLIGNSPPRIYWLQDGNVKARWDDGFADNILAAFNLHGNGKS
ncbi:MAG TPA: MauE/DoxX family redox-associated membrane protein [bacterium]